MGNLKERYCGYFPYKIMQNLNSVATIKIMFHILTITAMNKKINPLKICHKDIPGICNKSFYKGLKDLEGGQWIYVNRSNCHEYEVTLQPNYRFTKFELEFLQGRGRR